MHAKARKLSMTTRVSVAWWNGTAERAWHCVSNEDCECPRIMTECAIDTISLQQVCNPHGECCSWVACGEFLQLFACRCPAHAGIQDRAIDVFVA